MEFSKKNQKLLYIYIYIDYLNIIKFIFKPKIISPGAKWPSNTKNPIKCNGPTLLLPYTSPVN